MINLKSPWEWDAGKKGERGAPGRKKIERSEIFLAGVPGGIPIPLFSVAGTRSQGFFKLRIL